LRTMNRPPSPWQTAEPPARGRCGSLEDASRANRRAQGDAGGASRAKTRRPASQSPLADLARSVVTIAVGRPQGRFRSPVPAPVVAVPAAARSTRAEPTMQPASPPARHRRATPAQKKRSRGWGERFMRFLGSLPSACLLRATILATRSPVRSVGG
jgi:hypothetical protein